MSDLTEPSVDRGLRNIRQRARAANGEAEIDSAPGVGTTLTVVFSM